MDRSFWQRLASGVVAAAPYVAAAAAVGLTAYAGISYLSSGSDDTTAAPTAQSQQTNGAPVRNGAAGSTAASQRVGPPVATRAQSAFAPNTAATPASATARGVPTPQTAATPGSIHLHPSTPAHVPRSASTTSVQAPASSIRRSSASTTPATVAATGTPQLTRPQPPASAAQEEQNAAESRLRTPSTRRTHVEQAASTPFTAIVDGLHALASPAYEGVTHIAAGLTVHQVSVLLVVCFVIIALFIVNGFTAQFHVPSNAGAGAEDVRMYDGGMGSLGWGVMGLLVGTALSQHQNAEEGAELAAAEDMLVKGQIRQPEWDAGSQPSAETSAEESALPVQEDPSFLHTVCKSTSPISNEDDNIPSSEPSVPGPSAAGEPVEVSDMSAEECQTLHRYALAIDAAEKSDRSADAESLIATALAHMNSGSALPPLTEAACSIAFSDDRTAEQYHRDYPALPPLRGRHMAALLWRRARNCLVRGSLMLKGSIAGDAKACFQIGLEAALASLSIHEADADANKYAGIMYAKAAKDMKEKIASAYKIRDHTMRAIQIRPHDAVLHHILGVWCYEVASLGWIQRKVASALFGAPPTSTYEEALQHLMESEKYAVSPLGTGPIMTTRLKIAQAMFAQGNKVQASAWIAKSLETAPGPGEDAEDIAAQRDLAAKLGVTRR